MNVRILNPSEEAAALLETYQGPGAMASCLNLLANQFQVIQGRSQLLLSLSTLVLTITGFSGPKIAATNATTRWLLATGIFFVLLSTATVLVQSLRVRWITQIRANTDMLTLETIIASRNARTKSFAISLALLVFGLACYVTSVMLFLAFYEGP